MTTMMIRYEVKEKGVAEVTSAVEAAFDALREQAPEGIRFTYYRAPGSVEFIAVLELDEGVENPLLSIAAARELQATVAKWAVGEAPTPRPLEVIGAYDRTR